MSFKPLKFLKGIIKGIGKIFDKFPKAVKAAIHVGVIVTDAIRKFTDSQAADILTAIIPGDLDDKIKNKLREALPKIFIELKLAEQCSGLTDPNEIVQCGIKTLQQIEGDFQSAFLHDLSILIAQVAADGDLDWKDAVYVLQWYYDNVHKPGAKVEIG